MDILKLFSDELRNVIRQEMHTVLDDLLKQYTQDKWMDKKQLAEYWGVSVSYIDKKVNEIPHSATTPIAFLRSEADAWRKGELKKLEVVSNSNVSIKNYKSNHFKIGQ